jgi:transcriptional regulator GlxA family with amidase domain
VVRWAVAGSQGSRPVATDLGVSDRQLLRRFQARVGYGPRTLLRVLRFQRFLALASHMPGQGWPGLLPRPGTLTSRI